MKSHYIVSSLEALETHLKEANIDHTDFHDADNFEGYIKTLRLAETKIVNLETKISSLEQENEAMRNELYPEDSISWQDIKKLDDSIHNNDLDDEIPER